MKTSQVAWLALLIVPAMLADPAGAASRRVTQAGRDLERAKSDLRKAQQAADKARTELGPVESARLAATNAFQKASQSAAMVHSSRLGLPAAAAEVEAADADVRQIRESVVAALEKRADYMAATREAATASENLRKVNQDASLSVSQFEERSRELSAAIRRPLELQRQELARDSKYQEALRQRLAAQQRLARLEQQYKKDFAADSPVAKARDRLMKADLALASARRREAEAAGKVASAQARLDAAERAYEQAVAQSRRRRP